MKSDPVLAALPISDEQRIELTPRTIDEVATMLESSEPERAMGEVIQGAVMRGVNRYHLGYTIPMLATHVRLLERAIYDVIQEKLLSLNLSYLMFDMKRLNDAFGLQLEHTLVAFLDVQQRLQRSSNR